MVATGRLATGKHANKACLADELKAVRKRQRGTAFAIEAVFETKQDSHSEQRDDAAYRWLNGPIGQVGTRAVLNPWVFLIPEYSYKVLCAQERASAKWQRQYGVRNHAKKLQVYQVRPNFASSCLSHFNGCSGDTHSPNAGVPW